MKAFGLKFGSMGGVMVGTTIKARETGETSIQTRESFQTVENTTKPNPNL
jgi:hypothetical protein